MTGLDWAQSQADERPVPMSFVGSEGLSSGVPQRSRVHEAGGVGLPGLQASPMPASLGVLGLKLPMAWPGQSSGGLACRLVQYWPGQSARRQLAGVPACLV